MAPTKQSTTKRKRNADHTPPSEPAKRIKSSFSSPLKVLVGSEKEAVFVHEDVICASSAFFKAACSKTWKENQEKTVKLPTADPTAFHNYVDWLYNGDLNEGELQKSDLNLKDEAEANRPKMKLVHNLCKLWILADYLQDATCKVDAMTMLLVCGADACTVVDTVRLVVAETSEGSLLLNWLLDLYSASFIPQAAHLLPQSFQLALLKRLGEILDEGKMPTAPGIADLIKYVDG
ncbi:hypothetical protein HII31_10959 [Pseudocercospora fuligena]|uniref:BTB domain-containing protein n=1 Tax=Pseudocercospora fuligena TaxID=685502 RepID=A0A8H6R968_9PEZI|nr:hypothetical protein HII31_10959 [Pseudocercospora fuligena]